MVGLLDKGDDRKQRLTWKQTYGSTLPEGYQIGLSRKKVGKMMEKSMGIGFTFGGIQNDFVWPILRDGIFIFYF